MAKLIFSGTPAYVGQGPDRNLLARRLDQSIGRNLPTHAITKPINV